MCFFFLQSGESLRDRATKEKQDDGLHNGAVGHGTNLLGPGPQARQAHHPENGRSPHEGAQRYLPAQTNKHTHTPRSLIEEKKGGI